jgi:hypothetical protein
MAWTYTDSPQTVPADAVRFLAGDTVLSDPLVSDAEIDFALSINSNVNAAAAIIADAIATKFATMKISVKIGPISEEYGNRAEFYAKRAKELKNVASSSGTTLEIYAGGISKTDKAGLDSDNAGSFSMGMHDTPEFWPELEE